MTTNDDPRAPLRSCKAKQRHDEVRFLSVCLMHPALRRHRARSPDGGHTCLYVLVVMYIYDSSVQALDSRGATDDARRQGAGLSLNTQLVVNLLSKGLWVGLSLTSSRMRLLVSYRPLAHENRFCCLCLSTQIATWPYRETRPQTSLCAQQRLTDDHNSTNELTANFIEFPAAELPCT